MVCSIGELTSGSCGNRVKRKLDEKISASLQLFQIELDEEIPASLQLFQIDDSVVPD